MISLQPKLNLTFFKYIVYSVIISILSYFFMMKVLHQESDKAWGRSIIISSLALIYFVLFDYQFPPKEIQSQYI